MKGVQYKISASAILVFAAAYFLDDTGVVSAFFPAVAVHEVGHMIVLCLFGARIRKFSVGIFGLEIDYSGLFSEPKTALSLFAGPLFGALYAVAALRAQTPFLTLSGSISLILTAFNLIPVLPLDGGRLVACLLGEYGGRRLSRVSSVLLLLGGAVSLFIFGSASLLLVSAWIFLYNFRVLS